MTDALALYRLVMGEDWEDELRAAAAAREAAAARQRRSLSGVRAGQAGQGRRPRLGRALVRSVVARAAGSRAAVFKRIRSAGCHTGKALWRQLSYVNDKAELCFASSRSLGDGDRMTREEKTDLVERWQATWRGSTKLGYTSHMLLSFPEGTDPMAVRGIAVAWCEHFFDSALYGDRWEYVLAFHTDRAHPHAHILLNNRGAENGLWFSCWEGGVMSPQLMREKQAEIAGRHGVALEATTRLERGLFDKPAALAEIYAAKAEGRRADEIAMSEAERALAQAAVLGFAKEYRSIADALDRADRAHVARLVRQMAEEIVAGRGQGLATEEEIDMAEVLTVAEAMDLARGHLDRIAATRDGLDGAERADWEVGKADLLRDLALMVPDPETRTRYGSVLHEAWPPATDARLGRAALAPGARDPTLEAALRSGGAIGLDPEEQAMRIALGGTSNAGLAQDWIERDTAAVLRSRGLDPERATASERQAAWAALDAFNDRVTEAAMALAAERGLASAGEVPDRLGPATADTPGAPASPAGTGARPGAQDERVDGDRAEDRPAETLTLARSWLAGLAARLQGGDASDREQHGYRYVLEFQLRQEIGWEGTLALQKGQADVLAPVLPDSADRLAVAREYVEVLGRESGDPELARTAARLRAAGIELAAKAASRARSAERDRSRGLDDDLEL